MQVNPENAIITVTKNGRSYVKSGNELLLEEELGDLYYHREIWDYSNQKVVQESNMAHLSQKTLL